MKTFDQTFTRTIDKATQANPADCSSPTTLQRGGTHSVNYKWFFVSGNFALQGAHSMAGGDY
jgi:hypothetical protein